MISRGCRSQYISFVLIFGTGTYPLSHSPPSLPTTAWILGRDGPRLSFPIRIMYHCKTKC